MITEDQYLKLCKVCDDILMDNENNKVRTAIPFLHVMREHVAVIKPYQLFFSDAISRKDSIDSFFKKTMAILKRVFSYALRLFYMEYKIKIPEKMINNIDVIFVSHLVNEEHLKEDRDFYFGEMPNDINRSGGKAIVVLINHTSLSLAEMDVKNKSQRITEYIVLPKTMGIIKEVLALFQLYNESKFIKNKFMNSENALTATVATKVASFSVFSSAIPALRIGYQLKEILSKANAKMVVTTYEGHSRERMIFKSAREVSAEITCVAYQNTVLTRLQHACMRDLDDIYNPDIIATTGMVNKRRLENAQALHQASIINIGTIKGTVKENSKIKQSSATCLVIPEAIESECVILCDFTKKCAEKFPDINFIWRFHPLLTYNELTTNHPGYYYLPDNISISSSTLDDDILSSNYAIYRGTSAIVEAAANNVIPVYLSVLGELSSDLLFELGDERPVIHSVDELVDVITSTDKTDMEKIKKYCMEYFEPYQKDILLDLFDDQVINKI